MFLDDREDCRPRPLEREAIGIHDLLHRVRAPLHVERHLATSSARQMADDDVLGHGRSLPPLPLGRRAGLGAGRLRPDAERAGERRARARRSRRPRHVWTLTLGILMRSG